METMKTDGIVAIVLLVLLIYNVVLNWIIFTKAGRKGFLSLIPIYSVMVMFDIAGLSKWYILLYVLSGLLTFIPFIGVLASFVMTFILTSKFCYYLASSFGKSKYFASGIFLLSPVFLSIIAFSKRIEYMNGNDVRGVDYISSNGYTTSGFDANNQYVNNGLYMNNNTNQNNNMNNSNFNNMNNGFNNNGASVNGEQEVEKDYKFR
jgi:hypothetical protein